MESGTINTNEPFAGFPLRIRCSPWNLNSSVVHVGGQNGGLQTHPLPSTPSLGGSLRNPETPERQMPHCCSRRRKDFQELGEVGAFGGWKRKETHFPLEPPGGGDEGWGSTPTLALEVVPDFGPQNCKVTVLCEAPESVVVVRVQEEPPTASGTCGSRHGPLGHDGLLTYPQSPSDDTFHSTAAPTPLR